MSDSVSPLSKAWTAALVLSSVYVHVLPVISKLPKPLSPAVEATSIQLTGLSLVSVSEMVSVPLSVSVPSSVTEPVTSPATTDASSTPLIVMVTV